MNLLFQKFLIFVPYICALDFPISKTFNRGLIRTKTLAEGADICDFRYKKGRKTEEIFPSGFTINLNHSPRNSCT